MKWNGNWTGKLGQKGNCLEEIESQRSIHKFTESKS